MLILVLFWLPLVLKNRRTVYIHHLHVYLSNVTHWEARHPLCRGDEKYAQPLAAFSRVVISQNPGLVHLEAAQPQLESIALTIHFNLFLTFRHFTDTLTTQPQLESIVLTVHFNLPSTFRYFTDTLYQYTPPINRIHITHASPAVIYMYYTPQPILLTHL